MPNMDLIVNYPIYIYIYIYVCMYMILKFHMGAEFLIYGTYETNRTKRDIDFFYHLSCSAGLYLSTFLI